MAKNDKKAEKAAAPAMRKIAFRPKFGGRIYKHDGILKQIDPVTKLNTVVQTLSAPIFMKAGDEIEIPAEDFEYLIEKGYILSKEQAELRETLIGNEKAFAKLSDEEKNLIFNDIPEEV